MFGVFVASAAISVGMFVAVIVAAAVLALVARVVFMPFVSGAHISYMIVSWSYVVIAVAIEPLGVLKAELAGLKATNGSCPDRFGDEESLVGSRGVFGRVGVCWVRPWCCDCHVRASFVRGGLTGVGVLQHMMCNYFYA